LAIQKRQTLLGGECPFWQASDCGKSTYGAGFLLTAGLSSLRAKRAFQLDLEALVQFSAFLDHGVIGWSVPNSGLSRPRPGAGKFNRELPFADRVTSSPIWI